MKNLNYLLPLFAFVLIFSSCDPEVLNVANSGAFGVVRDLETGTPIPNAVVFINGPEGQSTTSDLNGNYRFENLPAGSYVINAQAERFISPNINVDLAISSFEQVDVLMEYESMLSASFLDFGLNTNELQIVVTNLLNVTVEVDTEEDESWITAQHFILSLEPGESEIITVKVNRAFMPSDNATAPLIVNIEEDFGFDIYESYVVTINASR